ncbi:helix-turn-helix domain-containing protein [Pokkaliibacter sp. CJK22405]|uniref:AraC family transcriptional regulator n=1 Tax=Pokkaliibacter sp. CJK22405 TaxID=3384615 RepID=UPI0039851E0B
MGAETTIWHDSHLSSELLSGHFLDFSYDVHSHDTTCFALLTRGAIKIRVRGETFVVRAGEIYAAHADEPHAGWPIDERGWSQRTLYIDWQQLMNTLDEEQTLAFLREPVIRDSHTCQQLFRLHLASEQAAQASAEARTRLAQDELYLGFARQILLRHSRQGQLSSTRGKAAAAVERARQYLEERLADNLGLDDISEVAGLPRYQLYRHFEKQLGMTPHAYQRQARIRQARQLLKGSLTLADIAASTGFADQAHMTRTFRSTLGVTPGHYRQALQG